MKNPARIAVLGLGDFGYHLACELSVLGHEVLAVDSDQNRVQEILPHVTKAAAADVAERAALDELGINTFDIVVVCVGQRLETAVLLVHYLRQVAIPRIVVKVANDEQADIVKLVGANEVIQPEQAMARKTALLIHHPRTVDYLELASDQLVIAGRLPSAAVGRTVRELALTEKYKVQLLGIWNPGQSGPPSPPTADRVISATDLLILAGNIEDLRQLRRLR